MLLEEESDWSKTNSGSVRHIMEKNNICLYKYLEEGLRRNGLIMDKNSICLYKYLEEGLNGMTLGIVKPFFRRSSSQKFPAIVVLIVSYQFYDKVRDRVHMIQVVFLEFFKKV